MVAQCSNPECHCEFRELSKGRLFLLPPTYPETIWKVERMIDHCHWLCPACALTHTILLENNQAVIKKSSTPVRSLGSPTDSLDEVLHTSDNRMPAKPERMLAASAGEIRRSG
jgi:hypothetical protein